MLFKQYGQKGQRNFLNVPIEVGKSLVMFPAIAVDNFFVVWGQTYRMLVGQ